MSSTHESTALALQGFGVAFGDRVVLADVTLAVAARGVTTLVGPAGTGKSTLLRTIAGLNDAHPDLAVWGDARLAGEPLSFGRQRPGEVRLGVAIVTQHARFFLDSVRENLVSALPNRSLLEPAAQTARVRALLEANDLGELGTRLAENVTNLGTAQQRKLALVRAVAAEPTLLVADEPTVGLEPSDAEQVLALLRRQAEHCGVLVVTHHQRYARLLGGDVALLAGGRIQEIAPADRFFDAPETEAARVFVRTGGCALPSPSFLNGARVEELDPATPPPVAVAVARPRTAGPRGFHWVRPGLLGGLPRPGIVRSVEEDVELLAGLGVGALVTAEETTTVDPELLQRFGISSVHFPIPDMAAPELAAADELCRRIDALNSGGVAVAIHCRAGLGRTGTLLAAQLVHDGESARDAIERVRRVNPRAIQSEAQVAFLSAFEAHVRLHGERTCTSATC